MKLNKLTSAVSISLAALVLTACGNDNNTPNTSSQNIVNENKAEKEKTAEQKHLEAELEKARKDLEKAKAEAEKAKAEAEKAKENIAKANNPVSEIAEINSTIKSFDVTKKPSVGGANYIRSEASNFDRGNNTVQSGSNIVAYSDTLQDKKLSNFVAASQSFTGADGKKRIYKNVLGATENQPNLKGNLIHSGAYGSGNQGTTIQDENGADEAFEGGNVVTAIDIPFVFDLDKNEYKELEEEINADTIAYIATVEDRVLYLAGVEPQIISDENPDPLVADIRRNKDSNQSLVEDYSDLSKSGLIITEVRDGKTDNYAKPEGLVVTKRDHTEAQDGLIDNQSTRVFGRAYDNFDLDLTEIETPNTYQASFNPTDDSLVALTPIKLNKVQYGRLTGTLDAIQEPKDPANIKKQYVARNFSTRNVDNSVDYYFYRGVDATSIADMAKVKATGVDINYQGHALVYGRDSVSGASNAVGGTPTFGNFVQATYKTATGDVNGSIYNFSVPTDAKTKADITKNDLITFKGTVKGNTVEGSATRLADSNPGSFIGSFYGKNANELGGAINSVDQNTAYGNTKWGAVFGAKTDIVAENDQTVE